MKRAIYFQLSREISTCAKWNRTA